MRGDGAALLGECQTALAGHWGLGMGAGAVGPLWERTSRPACLGLTCGLGLGLAGPDNGASVGLRLGPKLGLYKGLYLVLYLAQINGP